MNLRIAAILPFLAGLLTGSAPAATSPFTVAYFNLSGVDDGERPAAFVASFDATPGFSARLADKPRVDSWRGLPAGTDPAQWLSLVKIKLGQHCDFLAFRFADTAGTVAYAGRRPSRVHEVKYSYSVPPGPDQLPENAIRETATDFLFRPSSETARVRPLLRIRVEPWAEGAGSGAEAGGAPVRPDILEALAFAAAYEAGFQPTAGESPAGVRISAREELGLFIATRAALDSGASAWVRDAIPREALYDHLSRLFFRLRQPSVFFDSAAYASRAASLLSNDVASLVQPGRIRVEDDRRVIAVDPATGRAAWSYDPGDTLLAPPAERDGRVFLACKNNVITVLEAAGGTVVATRAWPTWLLGIAVLPSEKGSLVACTDLRRRLTFLRAADLATVREVVFPWELKGPVFYDEAARPAVLCQDRDDFLHAVIPPDPREAP